MDPAIASIIVSALTAIAVVVSAYMQAQRLRTTHDLVNSRMTELLALTRAAARAEGVKSEVDKK